MARSKDSVDAGVAQDFARENNINMAVRNKIWYAGCSCVYMQAFGERIMISES